MTVVLVFALLVWAVIATCLAADAAAESRHYRQLYLEERRQNTRKLEQP